MLLTIDVGNTNTVLGIFDNQKILHSWRVKTDPRDTADELWIKFRSLVEDKWYLAMFNSAGSSA